MNAQQKYYSSPKGQAKLRRQNEKRRNKTRYNKVVHQINCFSYLLNILAQNGIIISLKKASKLWFFRCPHMVIPPRGIVSQFFGLLDK